MKDVKGDLPNGRYDHCSCVEENFMYIFGGYDKDGFSNNDLFQFDFCLKFFFISDFFLKLKMNGNSLNYH